MKLRSWVHAIIAVVTDNDAIYEGIKTKRRTFMTVAQKFCCLAIYLINVFYNKHHVSAIVNIGASGIFIIN